MTQLPPFSLPAFEALLNTQSIGRPFLYHETVGSTMDLAREAAAEGAPHGMAVFAEEQTAGRGRRGRSFYSPARQNLYVTFVLRCPLEAHRRLPVLVPLAVCRAIGPEGVPATIKWPNDIWVGERKLSGMLIDGEITAAGAVALPGIGINVNGDPTLSPDLAATATSLRRELGRDVSREGLLARLCHELEAALAEPFEAAVKAYEALSCVLGRRVLVQPASGDAFEGVATTIAPDGALWVTPDHRPPELITAAEVSLRPI